MNDIYFLSNNAIFEIFSFIAGAAIGSFLNVCIYRIPQGKSIIHPSSYCPKCKLPIKPYHNIPIISFLYLRGRCSGCNQEISPQYLLVELLTGLLTFFLFIKFGISIQFIFYLILTTSLIIITFIDLRFMIIPNSISLPGILVGLFFNALVTDWSKLSYMLSDISSYGFIYNLIRIIDNTPILNSVVGIILGSGILLLIAYLYEIIRKAEGLGMGDVKLLAMIGAFLGGGGVIFTTFMSSLLGTIVGILIIILKKGDMKHAIPYGPFLSFAAVLYIFVF